jgi:nucleotide-binding universal stress UspA family protein
MAGPQVREDDVLMTRNGGDNVTRAVVCGVDGSPGARVALRAAARLAHELEARLVVVHVVQPQPSAPGLGPTARQLAAVPVEDLLAGGEAVLDRILEEEQLDDVRRRVVLGFAADRLADVADEEVAELIVVGSRGRGAFKAAFLGSVSTDVVAVARCPVLVVPAAAAAGSDAEGRPAALVPAL